MRKITYLIVSMVITFPFFILEPYLLLGNLAAILPDVNIKENEEEFLIKHSVFALLFTTIIIMLLDFSLGVVWLISYSIHLFLECLTIGGIKLFYPLNKCYGIKKEALGLKNEIFIIISAIAVFVINSIL